MIRVLWKSGGSKIYTFGSSLTPHFLWRLPKSKKRGNRARKRQPLGYRNMSKSRLYLLSPFLEKYDYFLHYLGYFSQERERGHRSEDQNQNVTYPISPTRFLVNFLWKKFVPILSSFVAIGHKRFSSLAAFLGTTPTFLKKMGQISWCKI